MDIRKSDIDKMFAHHLAGLVEALSEDGDSSELFTVVGSVIESVTGYAMSKGIMIGAQIAYCDQDFPVSPVLDSVYKSESREVFGLAIDVLFRALEGRLSDVLDMYRKLEAMADKVEGSDPTIEEIFEKMVDDSGQGIPDDVMVDAIIRSLGGEPEEVPDYIRREILKDVKKDDIVVGALPLTSYTIPGKLMSGIERDKSGGVTDAHMRGVGSILEKLGINVKRKPADEVPSDIGTPPSDARKGTEELLEKVRIMKEEKEKEDRK